MNQTILRELLDLVKANQHKQSEIDGKYNIFYALRIWQKEVTLHSRILTDLLRVDGYHGLKSAPLKAFIKLLPNGKKFQCDKEVEVTDEKGAGDNRRVDIFLKDAKGKVIIIENKIYAGDQDRQLVDYREFGLKQSDKPIKPTILYLTLNGTQPSKASCDKLEEGSGYFCISYRDLIKKWIGQCIKLAEKSQNTALTEVLKQYNQVIDYLVKQDMENVNEILVKISTQEDFLALNELSSSIAAIPSAVRTAFLEKLTILLQKNFPLLSKEDGRTVWCKIDAKESDNGLSDWFSIKESGGKLWCSLTVCKDNNDGKYLDEEPSRKEKFAVVYKKTNIDADCNASDFWFWLDTAAKIDFEDLATIKDILDSQTPKAVETAARKITELLNTYAEISAR